MRAAVIVALFALSLTAALSARDPAIDGKDYLLPASELRDVIGIARQRVAILTPQWGVFRIHVISAAKVEAYFGDSSDPEWSPGCLTLERMKGRWRITNEQQSCYKCYVTDISEIVCREV